MLLGWGYGCEESSLSVWTVKCCVSFFSSFISSQFASFVKFVVFVLFIFGLVGFDTVQMVSMSDSLPPQVVSNPALNLHLLLLLKCFVLAYNEKYCFRTAANIYFAFVDISNFGVGLKLTIYTKVKLLNLKTVYKL